MSGPQPPASPRLPESLSWRAYLPLALLSLLPRLALSLAFLHAPIGLDDMFQYDMLARSLAAGQGYRWYGRADVARMLPYLRTYYGIDLPVEQVPETGLLTTFRAPGYPFFLAGLYAVFGFQDRFAVARLAQVLLGAALAPATALLVLRLGLTRRAAAVAGVVLALYSILWMYPIGLASENTFLPLVLFSLLTLLAASRSGGAWPAALAGLTLGAATLTRGALVAFLPLAAWWLARGPVGSRSTRRVRVVQLLALSLAAAATLVPWMVRNSLILGRPAFVENSPGYNLFVGYHPLGDGSFDTRAAVMPLRILDDGERDRWTTAQALQFIWEDPLDALLRLPRRMARFWGLEDRELMYFYANNYFGPISQPWLALGYILLVSPLIALGLSAPFGMALADDRRGSALCLALIGATLLAYVPILADPRFHLPLIPVLAAYAANAWTTPRGFHQVRDRLGRRDPAMLWAAAAAALLIVLWIWDFALDWGRLQAVLSPGGNLLRLDY